jgi:molybdenum cofactor cytidylyltransferase
VRFGPVPIGEAEGAILAHALAVGTLRLRKSHRVTALDLDALREAGIAEVIAAVLDADDLAEDEAAARIAGALRTSGVEARAPATGRVNIHAACPGVFTVDKALIDAINRVDPAITIATVADHAAVERGQMVATVKIIPFAVASRLLDRVVALAGDAQVFSVHPFAALRVALIQTTLPTLKASVLDKTSRVTGDRLRQRDRRRTACAAQRAGRRRRHRRTGGRGGHDPDLRRLRHVRSGRRDSRGDPRLGRRSDCRRHASRSGQPAGARRAPRQASAWRARLRAQP